MLRGKAIELLLHYFTIYIPREKTGSAQDRSSVKSCTIRDDSYCSGNQMMDRQSEAS